MTKLSLLAVAALAPLASLAFVPSASSPLTFSSKYSQTPIVSLNAESEEGTAADAVFVPDAPATSDTKEISLEAAESLGKGAAKVSSMSKRNVVSFHLARRYVSSILR